MIYLDNAATTLQKPPAVGRAMAAALGSCASPGRAGHQAARRAEQAVYACRELAAELFGARPEGVIFTMNATHGLNLAIKSLAGPGDRVVISGFEHNAVTRPLHALGARVAVAGKKLFDPRDTIREFQAQVTGDTRAVVCTLTSNVFGYVLPINEIAALCRDRNAPLVVDASQGAGVLPVSLEGWGAAFIAMPGHKGLYGPQGTGLLLCADGQPVRALLEGGTGSQSISQSMPEFLPDRLEAGTHNVPGVCGLYQGLRFIQRRTPEAILNQERRLIQALAKGLERMPGVRYWYGDEDCQAGVLSFCAGNVDCEELAARLDRRGVAVRAGLHCAPLAHENAGTLETGTVRLSVSAFNTPGEIALALGAIQDSLDA